MKALLLLLLLLSTQLRAQTKSYIGLAVSTRVNITETISFGEGGGFNNLSANPGIGLNYLISKSSYTLSGALAYEINKTKYDIGSGIIEDGEVYAKQGYLSCPINFGYKVVDGKIDLYVIGGVSYSFTPGPAKFSSNLKMQRDGNTLYLEPEVWRRFVVTYDTSNKSFFSNQLGFSASLDSYSNKVFVDLYYQNSFRSVYAFYVGGITTRGSFDNGLIINKGNSLSLTVRYMFGIHQ